MEFAGSYDIVVHYSNVTPVIKNVGPMAFSYSDLLSVASDIARSMLVTEENTMIKLRYDVPTSNEGCMHYEHVVEMFIVHRMTDSIHLYVEVLINNINDDNHSLIGSNVANAEVGLLTNMSQDWENHIVTMGEFNAELSGYDECRVEESSDGEFEDDLMDNCLNKEEFVILIGEKFKFQEKGMI
ncbi:hypothetical protein M9H77_22995 [Catharanthus roseus]|uniref:Uncharacterized protein n=1 Tax=Catharanthus roseus TaxID=4058 RepID=A0ACC0ARN5_CATRO|nr:hypothetical protein M9H77_22995 [Catharanthus roseus]